MSLLVCRQQNCSSVDSPALLQTATCSQSSAYVEAQELMYVCRTGTIIPATAYHTIDSIDRMQQYMIVVFLPNSSENTKLISAPIITISLFEKSDSGGKRHWCVVVDYQQLRQQRIMLGSGP